MEQRREPTTQRVEKRNSLHLVRGRGPVWVPRRKGYICGLNRLPSRTLVRAPRLDADLGAQVQDDFLQGVFAAGYHADRADNTAQAVDATAESKIKSFIALKALMTRANIPLEGRYAVVPPEFVQSMEEHFIAQGGSAAGIFSPATADAVVRNGFGGNLVGFDLRVTTKIPTTGAGANRKWRCVVAQGNEAVTMAEQITSLEAYRPELRFGEAVKGLYVYGAKLVHSTRIFTLVLDDSTSG